MWDSWLRPLGLHVLGSALQTPRLNTAAAADSRNKHLQLSRHTQEQTNRQTNKQQTRTHSHSLGWALCQLLDSKQEEKKALMMSIKRCVFTGDWLFVVVVAAARTPTPPPPPLIQPPSITPRTNSPFCPPPPSLKVERLPRTEV